MVRGFSFFGASFVYIIFEDGTDIYWARSRVLEYLSAATARLPTGVTPTLGPDATGVGWVYQYVVTGANRSLAELRTLQDWFIRYQLWKASGVSEVASIGGFVQQYVVTVDPRKLQAYNLPLSKIIETIRMSNRDVGGRIVELSETEYMVRGVGYLRGAADLAKLTVAIREGCPGPAVGHRAHRTRSGRATRHRRTERRWRSRRRNRGRALRHARHRRHRQRQAAHQGDRHRTAGRGQDRGGVRPLAT